MKYFDEANKYRDWRKLAQRKIDEINNPTKYENILNKNIPIKGVIFDLDNTLLDFMKMKEVAVKSAIKGMIEAGLDIDEKESYKDIVSIYEKFSGKIKKYLMFF